MISKMAMEDIEELEEKGIRLTPEEVIRLNALGVRAERNPDASSLLCPQRCAFLGDIVFREPTIGHEIWLESMSIGFNDDDMQTVFLLRSFALSMDADKLPMLAPNRIKPKIIEFAKNSLKDFTLRQIVSTINYVMTGCDPDSEEFCTKDEDEKCDLDFTLKSIPVGIIHEAQAMKLGISLYDMKNMTMSELQGVTLRAKELNGFEVSEQNKRIAVGDYYKTKQEIINKHTAK